MPAALLLLALIQAAPGAALERRTAERNGLTREYWLHDPRARGGTGSGKRPLIVALHGGGGLAEKFDAVTGKARSLDALADREDILVAYPQGYKKQWNDGREVPHIESQALNLDDVGFIEAIVDELIKTREVDPRRVYAVGPSNGGHMANRLACDLSGKVAAVGVVIGAMPVKYRDKCRPSRPVSVLIMNGTEDPLVPFNGGTVRVTKRSKSRGEDISSAATFDFWVRRAGGAGGAGVPVSVLPDADPEDKTRVELQDFAGKDAEVAFYAVKGGGHTWPGGRQYLPEFLVGRVSRDVDATRLIWDFFKRNPKPR